MKKLLLFFIMFSSLFAYTDLDLDGVDDSKDRCLNTPFSDIVDKYGCTKKSLISNHHYDIVIGISYSQYNQTTNSQTLSSNLALDYFYKNFSLKLSTSYYQTTGSYSSDGMNDSYIGLSYKIKPSQKLRFNISGGIYLPTYKSSLNNNNTDYMISISSNYALKDFDIFGSYSYTIINDDNIYDANTTVAEYQNTNSFSFGAGYYLNSKIYISSSYAISNSIYTDSTDIQTLSFYGYYSINKHLFSTLGYSYGLSSSASDHYISLKLGYYF